MKAIIYIIFFVIGALSVRAEDVIVLQNGDLIKAVVTEITQTDIKYKKVTRPNGPVYTISKSQVLSINYEDGEKDTFAPHAITSNSSQKSLPETLNNGENVMDRINNPINRAAVHDFNELQSVIEENHRGGKAKNVLLQYGLTRQSIIADENLSLEFVYGYCRPKSIAFSMAIPGWNDFETIYEPKSIYYYQGWVQVVVRNKTDKIMYLDLAKSFITRAGDTEPYYIPETLSSSSSGSKGIGVNVGSLTNALGIGGVIGTLANGVNVGGGTSSGTTTTVFAQRIVAVPPFSKLLLEAKPFYFNKRNISNYNDYYGTSSHFFSKTKDKGFICRKNKEVKLNFTPIKSLSKGECISLQEESTNARCAFFVTYMMSENETKQHQLFAEFYIKSLTGVDSNFKHLKIAGIWMVHEMSTKKDIEAIDLP